MDQFRQLNLTNKNNKLLDTLKEKVYSTHMENCMARIKSNTEGKLHIFQTFTQDYCMEGYLLLSPNLKHIYVYHSQIQDELSYISNRNREAC